ncbi:hypothetical protein GCM10020331_028380 [Ectobacillus funiculus]
MIRILIVDDEKEIGTFLSHLFMSKGYRVTVVNSGKDFYYLDLKKTALSYRFTGSQAP